MTMITINKSKMFLPLSSAKGTAAQRLEKARQLNLTFYKNLQDRFIKREVKLGAFKQELQKAAGMNLGVEITEVIPQSKVALTHLVSNANLAKTCKIDKYLFELPFTFQKNSIKKCSANIFLRETQKFFNEILNPKFLAREVSLINKYKNLAEAGRFYNENIAGKNQLKTERLENLIKDKPAAEQIDMLQYFRYKLLSEENIHNADYEIDKLIEKMDNMHYEKKNYDLSAYNYDNKKSVLNKKLADILKNERTKVIK